MTDKEKEVRIVSPTGRICFLKNLFVSGGEKDRFSAALVFSSEQDLSKVKKLMMDAAKSAGFTKADIDKVDKNKVKVFSWGIKSGDPEEIEFLEEGDRIMNFDRNGSFGPPEVKSHTKGPDGKYEDLIDGDIKAGDHCRVLISAFGWEHKGKKGVKLNFEAVQFIKEGEVYYTPPTSDDAWDENEFDVEVGEAFSGDEASEADTGVDDFDDMDF